MQKKSWKNLIFAQLYAISISSYPNNKVAYNGEQANNDMRYKQCL